MKIRRIQNVEIIDIEMEGAKGVTKQILIGKNEGSDNIIMRLFTIQAGGNTPLHTHDFEHLVKIEKGRGIVVDSQGEHEVEPGMVIYVRPNEVHQFRNAGDGIFQFICIIPAQE